MRFKQQGFSLPLIIALIAILVIGGGVYIHLQNKIKNSPASPASDVPISQATSTANASTTATTTVALKTYVNAQYGFQIQYPSDVTVKENTTIAETNSVGTVFTFPQASGTNLDKATVGISVLPTCPVLANSIEATNNTYVSGGNTFAVESYNDAAMGGQRGLFTHYMLTKNGQCYVIEREVLYHDISFLQGVGVKNLPKAYDQAALDATFFKMLTSFITPSPIKPQTTGTLMGQATISQPINSNCPKPISNSSFGLKIYQGTVLISQFKFNADGNFKLSLSPGVYSVYGDNESPETRTNPDMWSHTFPQQVTIKAGETTTVNPHATFICNAL